MVEPRTDKEWQEYHDARTLAESQVINDDPARLAAAKKMAARIAEDEAEKAKAMKKIAGQRVSNQQSPTNPAPKPVNAPDPANPFNIFRRI